MGATFRVTRLHHVTVTTPEELEHEVLSYYGETLGLEPVEKPRSSRSGGAWFRAGDGELHVTIDPQNPAQTPHFCLEVDDFDEVVNTLRAAGRHIEQASEIPGRRRFFTRDPASNRIEIASSEEAST
jgi:catechol 2,3-dioxygenase-like lactoylglutathione lyase family enzyme